MLIFKKEKKIKRKKREILLSMPIFNALKSHFLCNIFFLFGNELLSTNQFEINNLNVC